MHRFFYLLFLLCHISCLAKPVVLVSIAPFTYFVEELAGDFVQVETLVPPGASPHTFEPSPKQVVSASEAVVWFPIGEAFEAQVGAALRGHNPDLHIYDVREGIDLIQGHYCTAHRCYEAADPHVWLSARIGQIIAKNMAEALQEVFPDHREAIEENKDSLVSQLEQLDQYLTTELKPYDGDALLVSHAALGYFCRDYNLKQLAIESSGKEPTLKHLSKTLDAARKETVRVVILETQFSNKGALLIAEQLDLPTCTINPLDANIPATLRHLATCIVEQ